MADALDQGFEILDAHRIAKEVLQRGQRGSEFFYFLPALGVPLHDRLDGIPLSGGKDAIRVRHQHFI